MNDAVTTAAAGRTITLGGETRKVFPLTLDDFALLQDWIDRQFPDPMEIAAREVASGRWTVQQQKHLLAVAMEQAAKGRHLIGTPEASEKLETVEGVKEILFVSVRKGDPSFTRADADRLYRAMSYVDMARVYRETNVDLVLSDPKATTPAGPTTP